MIIYTLNHLIKMLSNEKVATYFATLSGPTYQYARFSDWFRPELEEDLTRHKNDVSIDEAIKEGLKNLIPYE